MPLEQARNMEDYTGSLSCAGFHFIFTELTEGFWTHVKISLYVAAFVQIPLILYQAWLFLRPGLYMRDKIWFRGFFCAFILSGILGLIATHVFLLPEVCRFFLTYEVGSDFSGVPRLRINLEARIYTYSSLILNLLFWSSIVLQVPSLALVSARAGLIRETSIIKKRGVAYVILATISCLTAPPEVMNQILVITSFILLYEITVCILLFIRCWKIHEKRLSQSL